MNGVSINMLRISGIVFFRKDLKNTLDFWGNFPSNRKKIYSNIRNRTTTTIMAITVTTKQNNFIGKYQEKNTKHQCDGCFESNRQQQKTSNPHYYS